MVEVHDCFTIAEIMVIEALGLFELGEGGPAADRGPHRPRRQDPGQHRPAASSPRATRSGRPASPRSSRSSAQLRGEAGERQVAGRPRRPDPEHGRHRRKLDVVHILEVALMYLTRPRVGASIPQRYRLEAARCTCLRQGLLPAARGLPGVPGPDLRAGGAAHATARSSPSPSCGCRRPASADDGAAAHRARRARRRRPGDGPGRRHRRPRRGWRSACRCGSSSGASAATARPA